MTPCFLLSSGGSYLLVNASTSPLADPRGLLVSPPFLVYPGVPRCLHFSYQVSGQGADCCLLRVYLLDSRGILGPALWAQRGQIRGQWREAMVDIQVDTAYQVVLEGAVEPSQQGTISLDSIHMEQGECPEEQGKEKAGWCRQSLLELNQGPVVDRKIKDNWQRFSNILGLFHVKLRYAHWATNLFCGIFILITDLWLQ